VVAWWNRLGRLPHGLLHAMRADRPPSVLELPAHAVCQRCRTVSLLTATALRVSQPIPHATLDDGPRR
jgi:hypothetical protein